jgi:hypothetical protein
MVAGKGGSRGFARIQAKDACMAHSTREPRREAISKSFEAVVKRGTKGDHPA